jgi:hypothetical protein
MSTHIYGFRPPDEEWKKKKEAFDACQRAGVDPPEDLWHFFNNEDPDDAGVQVDIKDAVEEYHDSSSMGFQVDLEKLPKGIRYVRFVNSW